MSRPIAAAGSEQASRSSSSVSFALEVPKCSATHKRHPATDADLDMEKPSIARANVAISAENPHGESEYAEKFRDYHVLFWDRDNDGEIYPWDTYIGFRELGFNILFSLFAAFVINFNFSYPTRLAHSYLPDPYFRIYVDSIHKDKHGSDSGVYDNEGRFVPQKFEDIFSKWDTAGDKALGPKELLHLLQGNRVVADPFGWFAAIFEWGTTWLLIQRDGKVYKEDLRGIYDGSIFWKIREERRGGRQPFGIGGDAAVGGTKKDEL